MADRLILVGRLAGAFGVRGETRITTYTEDPMALGRYRELLRKDGAKALTIVSARPAKGGIIARAKEIETKEQADAMRGLQLFIPRDSLPPPEEDEFYLADLIGLSVEDPAGQAIGKVKSVQDFGAGDLLEIDPAEGGATWWLPFTKDAVPEVRLAEGKLVAVRPEETE
ncbi:ribosome maturation factor RimM [Phenylobacterium sp.]|uniref:ribosome maturation factor RimM n=1 Tax=Phenylobacterium sp. TaxID=1871053 RepID=UPI0035B1D510